MVRSGSLVNTFALIAGIFYLVEGTCGLFSDLTFGVFTSNIFHALIHIALGISGIALGLKQNARGYCIFLGSLVLPVGILRFIPVTNELLIKTLNINEAVAWLNIIVGTIALIVGYSGKTKQVR